MKKSNTNIPQIKLSILVFLMMMSNNILLAQQLGVSPYSQLGLGDRTLEAFSRTSAMGGVDLATASTYNINVSNPCMSIHNYTVIYEFGVAGQAKSILSNGIKDNSTAAALNYIGLSFPVKSKISGKKRFIQWGMGFGLRPISTMDYKMASIQQIQNDTNYVITTQKGKGGLNQFYWSNGFRINNNWSIGLQTSYIYGPIEKQNEINFSGTYLQTDQNNYLKTFMFKPALTYRRLVSGYDSLDNVSKTYMNLALTMDIYSSPSQSSVTEVRRVKSDGTIIASDTLTSASTFMSNIPMKFNLGIGFDNYTSNQVQKWSVAMQGSYVDWSSFENFNLNVGLGKEFDFRIGGEFTPEYVSTKSIFNRLTYRGGFVFQHTPITYKGVQVNDIALTFGLAFKIPKTLTNFNLGVTLGQKGNLSIIQEQYIKLNLGVNINDIWFIKRQLN